MFNTTYTPEETKMCANPQNIPTAGEGKECGDANSIANTNNAAKNPKSRDANVFILLPLRFDYNRTSHKISQG